MSSGEVRTPIRMIMFSSEHCKWCDPVEKMLRDYLKRMMMDELVILTVIDIDKDEESARRYSINELPSIMMNDEIILTGAVEEQDLESVLWTRILTEILNTEKSTLQRKDNIIRTSASALRSAAGQIVLRPSIGDYVHIGVLQSMMLALYALDPLVPELLYQAGKDVGRYGVSQYHISTLNPKIGVSLRPKDRFKQFLLGIEMYFTSRPDLPYFLSEKANAQIDPSGEKAMIYIKNLPTGAIKASLPEPMCDFTAGEIAGLAEAFMSRPAICQEVQCQAMGDEVCAFELRLVDTEKEALRPLPPSEGKEAQIQRRQNLYDYLSEIRLALVDSLFLRQLMRTNVGDFVHISLLQNSIISLKVTDKFIGSILYTVGRETGISGTGKDILYFYVNKNGQKLPLELEDALKIVVSAMSHPTTYLTREHSLVDYEIIEDEQEGVPHFYIRVEENAISAGIEPIGETLCDYTAGFISGRLSLLTYEEFYVKEIKCVGKGDPYCEFEVLLQ